jgi:hypothetical protein
MLSMVSKHWEDGKVLPMDKKPVLITPPSCRCPTLGMTQCVLIACSLINKHEHVWIGDNVCNPVHICSSKYVVMFQGLDRDTLLVRVEVMECAGESGN